MMKIYTKIYGDYYIFVKNNDIKKENLIKSEL